MLHSNRLPGSEEFSCPVRAQFVGESVVPAFPGADESELYFKVVDAVHVSFFAVTTWN